MDLSQDLLSQKNCRIPGRKSTGPPCQGRLASVLVCLEWCTRPEGLPHIIRQFALGRLVVAVDVTRLASVEIQIRCSDLGREGWCGSVWLTSTTDWSADSLPSIPYLLIES